jgi:hypothetical protein
MPPTALTPTQTTLLADLTQLERRHGHGGWDAFVAARTVGEVTLVWRSAFAEPLACALADLDALADARHITWLVLVQPLHRLRRFRLPLAAP